MRWIIAFLFRPLSFLFLTSNTTIHAQFAQTAGLVVDSLAWTNSSQRGTLRMWQISSIKWTTGCTRSKTGRRFLGGKKRGFGFLQIGKQIHSKMKTIFYSSKNSTSLSHCPFRALKLQLVSGSDRRPRSSRSFSLPIHELEIFTRTMCLVYTPCSFDSLTIVLRTFVVDHRMAPGQKKPQQGPANGQKKKGYNPYNKFKNRHWQKKKNNNENGSKPDDGGGGHHPNQSHAVPVSPVKVIQTPISK